MILIELKQMPSQNFAINLNDHNFDITLRDIGGAMLIDIKVDEKLLAAGLVVEPNQPVLQYQHLTSYGNFLLLCDTNEYPTWETLGVKSSLYYITPEEQQEIAND